MSSPRPNTVRADFESTCGLALDPFQHEALDALDTGRSVLVAAPTGSGKTIVAEYAVARALAAGQKAFYTTPLKALSNQKYGDLARVHGSGRVGLLTGDNSINGTAPVVVMTTEVLRNMIYARSPVLERLRYVVLDEVHYLQNPYRGAVWEEVIIHLPAEVDLVCLSATVSNAEEFADWIRTVRGDTTAVIEEDRPVELVHRYVAGERGTDALHVLPTFVEEGGELRPNPEAARLDSRIARGRARGRGRGRLFTPGRVELVERLDDDDLLPAIVFVFSRAGCDQAVEQCRAAGLRLTGPDDRAEIRRIAEAHTLMLGDDDLDVLRYDAFAAALEAGVAAHHAGMVPPLKEAVEEAFSAGLVKVVFATETLALGINMPARSVVIEKLTKFTGERHEFLTPGEYTQLSGRAGRRGIDEVGYAVVCWSPFVPFEQVAGLASRRTYALRSSFRPTYNMAANLVRRYPADEAHHLLNLSFAQYHADRDVVALERRLERDRAALEQQRASARHPDGDIWEYRRLREALEGARKEDRRGTGAAEGIEALRPGDIVLVGRRGSRAVVLRHAPGKRGARVLATDVEGELVRLGPDDFERAPRAVGHLDLPEPYAPRSAEYRRRAGEALRRARVADESRRSTGSRLDRLEGALAAHPLHARPELSAHLKAAAAAERLERETARLERRVRGRSESLARQFDRVLRVLDAWGYVDGWTLTDAGRLLTGLYTESDLLLAEAIGHEILAGLDPPELAALVSVFAYERRGDPARGAPAVRWPTERLGPRVRRIERLWRDLSRMEDDAGLPETRPPDPGFVPYAYAWAAGEDLAEVLDDELTGGDFVRNVKQLIDLLRQVGASAPDPETASTGRRAAEACARGVVAASSFVP